MSNINPEAKEILRGADAKVTQSAVTKVSHLAHYSDFGFASIIANISPEQAASQQDITDAC